MSRWIEYGNLQFQAEDLKDEFKLSRGFFWGFSCTRLLVCAIGECTHVKNHDESIHERHGNNMGVNGHGNKNSSSSPEFFWVTTVLEFLKTHGLIGWL
jgi:hypothetical protein